jgi:hypothetical protein
MGFAEAPETMVFTTSRVTEQGYPVLVVAHDADDGAWQFLCGTTNDPRDGVSTSLGRIIERHPEMDALADLPLGWIAWRESDESEWIREPRPN